MKRVVVFFLTLWLTVALVPQAQAAESFTQTSKVVFLKDAPAGTVGQVYSDQIIVYSDSSVYKAANMSASGGKLDIKLNGVDGVAFFFKPTIDTRGQTYGKFTIKFRAVGGDGNGGAMLLWPNSGHWNDGEIDYPEGKFGTLKRADGTYPSMKRFHHVSGANCPISAQYPYGDCHASLSDDTGQNYNDVTHTTSIEWTPTEVRYYLDGVKFGKTETTNIPTGDHRYTVQTGPGLSPTSGGHLYIYAATIYKWTA